ncbi:hypothetical protein L7F22_024610 [Adiantum nelumboides]|nr:hypothetical protein [Adiantum nelumboides]
MSRKHEADDCPCSVNSMGDACRKWCVVDLYTKFHRIIRKVHKASDLGEMKNALQRLIDFEDDLENANEWLDTHKGDKRKSCSSRKSIGRLQKACKKLRETYKDQFEGESSDDDDIWISMEFESHQVGDIKMEEKEVQKELGQESLKEPLANPNLPLEYAHVVTVELLPNIFTQEDLQPDDVVELIHESHKQILKLGSRCVVQSLKEFAYVDCDSLQIQAKSHFIVFDIMVCQKNPEKSSDMSKNADAEQNLVQKSENAYVDQNLIQKLENADSDHNLIQKSKANRRSNVKKDLNNLDEDIATKEAIIRAEFSYDKFMENVSRVKEDELQDYLTREYGPIFKMWGKNLFNDKSRSQRSKKSAVWQIHQKSVEDYVAEEKSEDLQYFKEEDI